MFIPTFGHDTFKTKEQSKQCTQKGSPPPKMGKAVLSSGKKVVATLLWHSHGIILDCLDYLGMGEYDADLLQQLDDTIKEKRPKLAKKEVLLYQDKAPPHKFTTAIANIYNLRFVLAPHSSNMAPSCYYLFPNLRKMAQR